MGGVGGAQITILTSDKVCVYQNVPADQAHAIMLLLSNGNSQGTLMQCFINTDQPTADTNTLNSVGDEVQFRSSTSPCPSPHRITQVEKKKQLQQRSQAGLPIARRTSVGRLLEKRKERVDAKLIKESSKVHPGSPACKKIHDPGQVLEIVKSGRLPPHFSEMDPLLLKMLRSHYRNEKPTPPCPRSPCPNPANTAFRSLNIPRKTLILKPVFDCKSCKHRFTLNGRTAPIRPQHPRGDAGNRQAAPDHSSPPSFSSTPSAEQQLQAAGQITTHNREHGKLQQQQLEQQQGAEHDLMLERQQQIFQQDEAVHNIELTKFTNTEGVEQGQMLNYCMEQEVFPGLDDSLKWVPDHGQMLNYCMEQEVFPGLDDSWKWFPDHDCMQMEDQGKSTSLPVNEFSDFDDDDEWLGWIDTAPTS